MDAKTVKKQGTTWETSEDRSKLIDAADRAGKIFERIEQEREAYELRELARKIRTA